MTQWYAVRTATRREQSAMNGLAERKFVTYLPMLTRWSTPARSGRREPVQCPLMPGYLFVLCDTDDFATIRQTEAVHAFVTVMGPDGIDRPIPFAMTDVHGLQAEERAGVYDYTRTQRVRYQPKKGDRVRVVAGPYLLFFAKVIATPKGERVHVMLEGPQPRGQTLNVAHVERAA